MLLSIRHSKVTIKPDTFTGEDDWEQYISHFDNCAELGGWSDRERVLTLAACLKGQARIFYAGLLQNDKQSYRLLVHKLEQRFGSARQHGRWLSRFQSRVRVPGETIASFGDDLRLMAQKAYPALDADAQELLALQQFYKAVTPEMRCRILDKNCISISDAVDVVERYEEILGIGCAGKRAIVRAVSDGQEHVQQAKHTDGKLSEIQSALSRVVERLDRLEGNGNRGPHNYRNEYRGPRTCFICDSPKHFSKQCPRYRQNGTQMNQGNGRQLSQ